MKFVSNYNHFHRRKLHWKCHLQNFGRFTSVSMYQLYFYMRNTVYWSRHRAAYMRRWTGSASVQVMACRLFGAKAIIWTNADFLSIGPLGTNFSEIRIEMQNVSFMKMHLNLLSAKWRPFCPRRNELKPSVYLKPLSVGCMKNGRKTPTGRDSSTLLSARDPTSRSVMVWWIGGPSYMSDLNSRLEKRTHVEYVTRWSCHIAEPPHKGHTWTMETYWCHGGQKNRHILTAPEHLLTAREDL